MHLDPMAVVTGGRDGGVLQRQNRMRRPAIRVRRFYRDDPCLAIGAQAHGTHLTVDADKGVGNPMIAQGLGEPVDTVALGDAVQVQRDGRGLAQLHPLDLQHLLSRAAGGVHRGADTLGRGGPGPETPGRHRIAHADIEGPARGTPDLEPEAQDRPQLLRHHHPIAHRRRIDPHERALRVPHRHLRVHLVDSRLKGGTNCIRVADPIREEQRRPARAHGGAVQGDARALSRHLRHTAPLPLGLRA